jgi:LytS/YehU family sensor histidine kinase
LTLTLQEKNGVYIPLIIGFLLNSIVLVIEESILLKNKKTMVELENAQLRIKNTEASYLQLKQQIHPHFLFNSLNILKTLIKKNPDTAVDYIIKLSDFLRVAISSNNSNTVKLENELKLCLNYLEMQKIRFGKALEFSFDIPEEVKSQGFLPVFAIQLLLENAIKHNSLTDHSPLKINVFHQDGWITVSNNLQAKSFSEISTGLGLTNLSERYKILSDSNINIQANDKIFSVSIKILPQ